MVQAHPGTAVYFFSVFYFVVSCCIAVAFFFPFTLFLLPELPEVNDLVGVDFVKTAEVSFFFELAKRIPFLWLCI